MSGQKICYDNCDTSFACFKLSEDLIKHMCYEKACIIALYWLLSGCQLNEDGARLFSNDANLDEIAVKVNAGHKYHMFYLIIWIAKIWEEEHGMMLWLI